MTNEEFKNMEGNVDYLLVTLFELFDKVEQGFVRLTELERDSEQQKLDKIAKERKVRELKERIQMSYNLTSEVKNNDV